jgi:hypothetical protein
MVAPTESEKTHREIARLVNELADDRTPEQRELQAIEQKKADRLKRINRSRNEVRRLVAQNFTVNHTFMTLTFSDDLIPEFFDIHNVRQCNRFFSRFMRQVRIYLGKKRGKPLKYLAVIEFQDANGRGAVHYHLILNRRIELDQALKFWGVGSIDLTNIKKVKNIGAYVSSYLTKSFVDQRLDNSKLYWTSKNLTKPIVLYYDDLPDLGLTSKKCFINIYGNDQFGKIIYKQYKV